ncbi:MAG: hypothetical protein WC644_01170 [Ignavibacteria bacterium]
MAWESNGSTEQKTSVYCNGKSYDITGLYGLGLVEKLKSVARENGISKFDIFDSTNRTLSPGEIESGSFNGDLNLVRFNVAA